MNRKIVITIAREHGSGGLKVGKRVAEELGINCYDSEMFQLVSDSKNLRDNHVAHDDRIKGTSLFSVARTKYADHEGEELPKESDDFLSMKDLFEYQSEIIRALADKEPCVIVGRCSNYILKDRADVISVFIHAGDSLTYTLSIFVAVNLLHLSGSSIDTGYSGSPFGSSELSSFKGTL